MPRHCLVPSFIATQSRFGLMVIGVALFGLSACADRPDLSGRVAPVDPNLPWPTLLSSSMLPAPDTADQTAVSESDALSARARALEARGQSLSSQPVLSQAERAALTAALARQSAPS